MAPGTWTGMEMVLSVQVPTRHTHSVEKPGGRPVVGDWNGDGTTKIGIYKDGSLVSGLERKRSVGRSGTDKVYNNPVTPRLYTSCWGLEWRWEDQDRRLPVGILVIGLFGGTMEAYSLSQNSSQTNISHLLSVTGMETEKPRLVCMIYVNGAWRIWTITETESGIASLDRT